MMSCGEELESLLLSADVGIKTAEKLLTRVKERVRQDKLTDSSQIIDALKSEIIGILRESQQKPAYRLQMVLKLCWWWVLMGRARPRV